MLKEGSKVVSVRKFYTKGNCLAFILRIWQLFTPGTESKIDHQNLV